MARSRTKLRRAARWLLAAALVLIVALALLPLWLPWILRPTLRQFGMQFGTYERISFGRFAIRDITGEWQGTTLRADRIECLQPATWLSQRNSSSTNREPGVVISGAVLTIGQSTNAPSGRGKTNSLAQALDQVARIGAMLRRELPVTRLTNCAVVLGKAHLQIPAADWRGGNLLADVRTEAMTNVINFRAAFAGPSEMSVALNGFDSSIEAKFTREANNWKLRGEALWFTNHAEISANFAPNGWWPASARIESREVRVPAELVRAPGDQPIRGSLLVNVTSNQFELRSEGSAQSEIETNEFPRVEFAFRAHGDPDSVTLDQLHLQTPWLRAELTNQIGIKRSGELLGNVAQLRVNADFSKIPGTNFAGNASGAVSVEARGDRKPLARFEFTAAEVHGFKSDAKSIVLRGEFDWPVLRLEKLSVEMADGSTVRADGIADVLAREVREAKWQVSGRLTNQFVSGVSYQKVEGTGDARGAFTNLIHRGRVTIEKLQTAASKPANVELEWNAAMLDFTSAKLQLVAAESALTLSGRFNFSKSREISATLKHLSLSRTNETLYALQQPCNIMFRRLTGTNSPQWKLEIDQLNLGGTGRQFTLAAKFDWPTHGSLVTHARAVALDDLEDFFKRDVGRVTIAELDATNSWSNSPLQSSITGTFSVTDPRGGVFNANGRLTTGDAIKIEQLTVGSDYAPALAVQAEIPTRIIPGRAEGWLVADEQRAIALHVTSQSTNPTLTVALGSLGKLQIVEPDVQIHASGRSTEPAASIDVRARSVDWQTPTNAPPRPRFENLELHVELRPTLVELRRFAVSADGQPIVVSGEVPMSALAWRKLWRERTPPDWKQGSGRLQIVDAKVAALSRYLPKSLSPEGQLTLEASVEPGPKLSGWLLLTNAATRPFGSFTPLRDIGVRVRLEGPRATLEEFRGQIGGQPVRANGFVNIPLDRELDYEVDLQSTNVPLARNVEFLLRGDMQMKLKGSGTNPPTIMGNVTLHDGLYLQYANDFVWSKPKRPELRPPYFSVTNEPFADWKLDLKVQGERFLRVRTPIFSGALSANVQLQGTLGEPEMTGDARVASGRINFPFGTLNVERGDAVLNSADPRGPDLRVHASGRNFNYAIRLEVMGAADGANISFSSTPPLTSEEILLMLTAGKIPQGQFTYSTEQRASRIATFVGKDLFSRFSGGGTGEERLLISTGENVSEEGKLTYSVEYKFTDAWSIIGEYDRFNAFNAHLKWKVISD